MAKKVDNENRWLGDSEGMTNVKNPNIKNFKWVDPTNKKVKKTQTKGKK